MHHSSEIAERKGDIPLEQVAMTTSWGERLLPYLYIAMESCWIYAIFIVLANGNFFQSNTPLLPLWGPFVIFAGSYFFAHRIDQGKFRQALRANGGGQVQVERQGSLWFFALVALLTMLVTWGSVYITSYAIFDLRWLGAIFTDLLLLTPAGYKILGIWAIAGYFCWRGLSLSRRTIEPNDVLRNLRIGIVVILLALLLTGSAQEKIQGSFVRLLLIPLFIALALMAHALARAVYMRHTHPVGLQGGAAAQERSLFLLIGSVSLVLLLVAFTLGLFVSPATLKDIQQGLAPIGMAYDWLVSLIATLIVWLLTPIFWLVSLFHLSGKQQKITQAPQKTNPAPPSNVAPESVIIFASVLKIVLPLLILALIGLAIFLFVTHKRKVLLRARAIEVHENLWSWELFRAQLLAFFQAIWQRLFGKKQAKEGEIIAEEPLSGPATSRGVREIYRAMLKWAAQHGLPRKQHETPDEFQQRLLDRYPQKNQELNVLTDAYTAIRYGGIVPDENELHTVEKSWSALQQKM